MRSTPLSKPTAPRRRCFLSMNSAWCPSRASAPSRPSNASSASPARIAPAPAWSSPCPPSAADLKVLSFNEFGLVSITRKRTKQALERVLCQPCPYCTGSGMVKSVPTICYEIQAEARKMAGELDSQSLTLRVNPESAKALKTRESSLIEELEQGTRKSVIIQSDPTLHWEQYDIY